MQLFMTKSRSPFPPVLQTARSLDARTCGCCKQIFLKLLKKGLKECDIKPIDCALYLFQPVRIIAMFAITLLSIAQTLYPTGDIGVFQLNYLFSSPWIWNTIVIAQLLTVPAVLVFEGRMNWKVVKGYIPYYFYTFTWFPISVVGVC